MELVEEVVAHDRDTRERKEIELYSFLRCMVSLLSIYAILTTL